MPDFLTTLDNFDFSHVLPTFLFTPFFKGGGMGGKEYDKIISGFLAPPLPLKKKVVKMQKINLYQIA